MSNKNPNTGLKRSWNALAARWSSEDYPGGAQCFRPVLLARDIGIWFVVPLVVFLLFRACGSSGKETKHHSADSQKHPELGHYDSSKSQIISFAGPGGGSGIAGIGRRAPGGLVRVKLMNVVATYATAPVHAQITDAGLGQPFVGGILIGDATPDANFERINITFKFAREPGRENFAAQIAARALSLDGTLGVEAKKKEGFFTRSVYGSATGATANGDNSGSTDFRDILLRALSAGFLQEFNSGTQVEKNRSQVLTVDADTEFFAELTDFFPAGAK